MLREVRPATDLEVQNTRTFGEQGGSGRRQCDKGRREEAVGKVRRTRKARQTDQETGRGGGTGSRDARRTEGSRDKRKRKTEINVSFQNHRTRVSGWSQRAQDGEPAAMAQVCQLSGHRGPGRHRATRRGPGRARGGDTLTEGAVPATLCRQVEAGRSQSTVSPQFTLTHFF